MSCSRSRERETRHISQALISNDGAARGLDALVTELQRVAQFGFTATELERAKQTMMAGSRTCGYGEPGPYSASRADEYTRNFLEDEALPTIWQELAFHRRFVPGDHARRDQRAHDDWFPEANRLVVVSAPEEPASRCRMKRSSRRSSGPRRRSGSSATSTQPPVSRSWTRRRHAVRL